MTMLNNVIGIVGGMGPQAGAAMLEQITRLTPAGSDQDHRAVIVMSYPGLITDRTAFVEGREPINPAYALARIINCLEQAGASVAGMACNSAHVPEIYDVIVAEMCNTGNTIRLLHMPDETCHYARTTYPHVNRVGIMSTNSVYATGLYPSRLSRMGFVPIVPDERFQYDVIHRMIYDPQYGLKARAETITPQVRAWSWQALQYFKKLGADAIVLGCTEFCFAIPHRQVLDMHLINSSEALAHALIRETAAIPTALVHTGSAI